MSWFEQGTSNARCIIIQFHRPAELKLKRMCRSMLLPYVHRTYGSFCFQEGRHASWITAEVPDHLKNDGNAMAAGACAHSCPSARFFRPSFLGRPKTVAFCYAKAQQKCHVPLTFAWYRGAPAAHEVLYHFIGNNVHWTMK